MYNWVPIVAILVAFAIALASVMYFAVTIKVHSQYVPDDFADTEPMEPQENFSHEEQVDVALSPVASTDVEVVVPVEEPSTPPALEPPTISPALQAAQDNLNHKLWHQLIWLIPNTQWIQTQYQSLAEVRWLCLGPDHHYFIARAELCRDEWKWSFTRA